MDLRPRVLFPESTQQRLGRARYCVGLSPIRENARRHAWISGSSPSDVAASRDEWQKYMT